MSKKIKLEINDQFREALDLISKGENLFITGRAGTGKSTLLNYLRQNSRKKMVVLAPTGVAAVNIAGQTIHSFFGFKPDITWSKVRKKYSPGDKQNIYARLETIVIDEISMVRADLLDYVDKFLRLNRGKKNQPFGGAQMIFIGDLYQLPPVLTGAERKVFEKSYNGPYFFNSKIIEEQGFDLKMVELEKIYRQKDDYFIDFLNKIRNNSVTEAEIEEINRLCLRPDFESEKGQFYVHLTPTNKAAREINNYQLARLEGEEYFFPGVISGKFEEKNLPAEKELSLKPEAQVMLVNNDKQGRWVNGTIAKVVEVEEDEEEGECVILVELPNGSVESVLPHTWNMYNFYFDQDSGAVKSKSVGSFTQYPLRLAWAVTIHKAQGKTFPRMILDIGRGTFAHGQMYVALSRCVSLDGLVLKRKISPGHIWMDWRVVKFLTRHQYEISEKELSLEEKTKILEEAVSQKQKIKIVYLKSNDTKSERIIKPFHVGEGEYMGKRFPSVEGYCLSRQAERIFRIDRILKLEKV